MGFETKVLEKIEPFLKDSLVEFSNGSLFVDNINPAIAESIGDVLSREFKVAVFVSAFDNGHEFSFDFVHDVQNIIQLKFDQE